MARSLRIRLVLPVHNLLLLVGKRLHAGLGLLEGILSILLDAVRADVCGFVQSTLGNLHWSVQ
jgi:hypothetical protein